MDNIDFKSVIEQLKQWGVIFDKGLSSKEIQAIETEGNFHFPEDLREFLQLALPLWEPDYESGPCIYEAFPNWRTRGSLVIRIGRNYLLRGFLFQVKTIYDWEGIENGPKGYWSETWGTRPPTFEQARAIVEKEIMQAPLLIPVYSHRFIPTDPPTAGNPVFSIVGTDIIHYGPNLAKYFFKEFGQIEWIATDIPSARIRFWDDFALRGPSDLST